MNYAKKIFIGVIIAFNLMFGNNTNYLPQSFSRKISNGAFSFEELQNLGEILGFDVKLELKELSWS